MYKYCFSAAELNYQHTTMAKIKTVDKASIQSTESKSTEIGFKETEGIKVLTTVAL
jgi:hypothetical protein